MVIGKVQSILPEYVFHDHFDCAEIYASHADLFPAEQCGSS